MSCKFEVIVNNVGCVLVTDDKAEALRTYHDYVLKSNNYDGRASGENVYLLCGYSMYEYNGRDSQ